MEKNKNSYKVYVVECADGSLYCGITTDLKRRMDEHNRGLGCKYTRGRKPIFLRGVSGNMTHSEALKFERYVKKLPSHQKISVVMKDRYERELKPKEV